MHREDQVENVRGAVGVAAERKQADAAARESEDRFRNMADHSPLMLWVTDQSGTCTYVNRRWCEFTGHIPQQGTGLQWLQAVHPEDRPRAERMFRAANAKQEPLQLEYRLQRHDRQYRWVIDAAAPRFADRGEFLGYVGSLIDIQEWRESEDQLRQSREQLQLISDSVPALLSYVDTERRYRMCNHAYQVWFGIAPGSIIGKTMREVLGDRAWDAIRPHIDSVFAGNTEDFEVEANYARGGKRWIHAHYTPHHDAQGKVIGMVVLVMDITARVRAEEAARQAHALLDDRAKHLEQLVSERTARLQETIGELEAFSYSISHDMRAPLRAMQGFGRMLEEDAGDILPQNSKDYLRRIMKAAERMDRLILDVLNYSRVARDFDLRPVSVGDLITELTHSYPTMQPPAASIHIEGPLPVVMGNVAALTQCFSNLLGNAIKFVKPGVTPTIRIWAERSGVSKVKLYFQDNGIGIANEHQVRIFAMFQKLSTTYEGTGIGLAIVKKAVERMGGAVGVVSEPDKGSTFWLELQTPAS